MKRSPATSLLPLLALSASLSASPAWAHPGDHSSVLSNFVGHLLTEPDHLALVLLCVAAVAGFVWYRRRSRRTLTVDRGADRDGSGKR
ncbi:MAG TPA: hypothetical protein PKA20_09590 [Burkholderiaceae bacterium]|nr:hypothetical protein [Burkholderiaceae bacterium]